MQLRQYPSKYAMVLTAQFQIFNSGTHLPCI